MIPVDYSAVRHPSGLDSPLLFSHKQWVRAPEFPIFKAALSSTLAMKLQGCKTQHGNASAYIGYLMRTGESGLLCTSSIMQNADFQRDLHMLQEQQRSDFKRQFPSAKVQWWQNRELSDSDSSQVHATKARILARSVLVQDAGVVRRCRRTEDHTRVQETVHAISVTQRFHQTAGLSSGKDFIEPFPKSVLTDPDGAEKIKKAVLAVRDCFPPNLPLVLTVHFDKQGNNPHIQGWVSSKSWNLEKGCWDKPHELVDTPAGLAKLWVSVEQAVHSATGSSFNRVKEDDPLRPVRTVFHPKTSFFVQQYSRTELLKGDFLAHEQHSVAKEAARQLVEQLRYDDHKALSAVSTVGFNNMLSTAEEIKSIFKTQVNIAPKDTNSSPGTSSIEDIEAAMRNCSAANQKKTVHKESRYANRVSV